MASQATRDRLLPCCVTLMVLAALACRPALAAGEAQHWTTVPGKSRVIFEASFALGDFTGQSEDVSGDFVGDSADLRQGVSGVLRVKPGTLRTGVDGRDRDMWRALAVDRYPEIRFTVQRVESSFPSVSERADVLLTVSGLLLIRGVERATVFPCRIRLREDRLWVRGEARLNMSDFGITPPRKLFLQVQDGILATFDVLLAVKN